VCCTTPEEVLRSYPRGKALVSLLHNQSFAGVEAFAVACQNALGEDVDTVLLELCKIRIHRNPGELCSIISRKMAA
jgi:glutamine synthetase type III